MPYIVEVDADELAVLKRFFERTTGQNAVQDGQSIMQDQQASKQNVQGSGQDRTTMAESKQEEINTGEGFRKGVFNDAEMYAVNKKLVTEREQFLAYQAQLAAIEATNIANRKAALEVAEREAKIRHQADLDHLFRTRLADQDGIKYKLEMDHVKFATAVSEPIAPNTQVTGNATSKGE